MNIETKDRQAVAIADALTRAGLPGVESQAMRAFIAAAEQYEPTPQEIRWGMIESKARTLADEIGRANGEGVPEGVLDALRDLRIAMGYGVDSGSDHPL